MTAEGKNAWTPYAGDGNAAYLDKVLCHQEVELSLDDGVNIRFIISLVVRALLAALLVGFAVSIPLFMLALATESIGLLATASTLPVLIGVVVFAVVLLATRVPEPVAEWRVLLPDRARGGDSVYHQIVGTLRVRQSPIGGSVRRIRTGPGPHEVSNRLVLIEGHYSAYVSVFPYGTGLYLGWTMWRSRRGGQLVWRFLTDLLEGIIGRNDPEHRMMRTERPRAMREAVHAACREGLFVGIENTVVPVEYGFPEGLPPIEDDIRPAPVPGSRPTEPGRP